MSDPITTLSVAGRILDLPKPVVETGCKLVESLLGEPCKIAGEMLADQLYFWQWLNRVRMANRADAVMKANGIAVRVLPPGFLVPLLQAAGDVDDPELQEMWANLLASGAADEKHCHPAFIHALRSYRTTRLSFCRGIAAPNL